MEATKTTSPPPAVPAADSQLHFLDYWRIIRIRKTVILAVFLLVVLTTTAVTFVLKESYSSTVRIAVEKASTDIEPLGRVQMREQYDPYFIQTEFEKIQSKSVLYTVIEELGLNRAYALRFNEASLTTSETYLLLRRNLDVHQSRNTSLIEIRVFSEDKLEAAKVANAIAERYRKWRSNYQLTNSQAGVGVLSNKLTEISTDVALLRSNVDSLRERYKIPDSATETPTFQSSLEREMVSARALELTKANTEFVAYDTKLKELLKLDRETLRKTVPTALASETQLPRLQDDLALAEQQLAKLRIDYASEHPEVRRIVAVVASINKQIDDRLIGILTGLSNQVISVKAGRDQLKADLEEAKKQAAEEARQSGEYFRTKRDLESKQKIRDAILLRTMQEEVDMNLPNASMVQVVDWAEPGIRPVRPNIPLNIALGAVVGLIMGVGLAFFIEYLDTSVKTIDDVERALQAPVLGVIPQNIGNLLKEGPDSPHAEAYRVLRTNVMFSRKNPETNTLTAVSGGAGEGKSTTIFNLATVFAQNGQRVLMVDSDLRRPSLHKFLGISNTIGLTNYLLKQNTLEEVIQTTTHPNLDFMPSGKLPSSSLGILNR